MSTGGSNSISASAQILESWPTAHTSSDLTVFDEETAT